MLAAQVRGLIWDVFKDWSLAKDGGERLPQHEPPAVTNGQAGEADG